jgi:hypothetical protein
MVIINFLKRGKSGDNKNRIFRFNKLNENEREVFEKTKNVYIFNG